ncbi:hypothetical protein HPP92_010763 [Vanilla planifolia]|uniref:Uncharacterized protein n=1 Tax=Vanilla planifolia TaxID=51239 RepID=A0A835V158_VANPL|nr:hypothetical protein HPP92_010763 [Vanilla planifolia]
MAYLLRTNVEICKGLHDTNNGAMAHLAVTKGQYRRVYKPLDKCICNVECRVRFLQAGLFEGSHGFGKDVKSQSLDKFHNVHLDFYAWEALHKCLDCKME